MSNENRGLNSEAQSIIDGAFAEVEKAQADAAAAARNASEIANGHLKAASQEIVLTVLPAFQKIKSQLAAKSIPVEVDAIQGDQGPVAVAIRWGRIVRPNTPNDAKQCMVKVKANIKGGLIVTSAPEGGPEGVLGGVPVPMTSEWIENTTATLFAEYLKRNRRV